VVRIRDVAKTDLAWICALNEASVPNVTSIAIDELSRLVDMASIAVVVESASEDARAGRDQRLGFCIVLAPGEEYASVNYRWFMERYSDAAYLDRVVVDEVARGMGVGKALYSEVERRLIEHWPHLVHLTLEVNLEPANPASMAFHRRLGFAEVGQQSTSYGARVSMQAKRLTRS
jgi:hypothetical protein